MRFRTYALLIAVLCGLFLIPASSQAVRDHSQRSHEKKSSKGKTKTDKPNGKEKSFESLIEDKVVIEGLFTFYLDTVDNSMLMAITPEQFGPIFLCGESRTQAEGNFFDNGSMRRTFPFYFKQVGKQIMLLEKNLRIRADSGLAIHDAVASGISDFLVASTEVKSTPHDSTKAILVDAGDIFIQDAGNIGYFLGTQARTGLRLDKKNSYFGEVKSFPENSEISVRLLYSTNNPQSGTTMQNPYSFFHTYHYSLSTLPETDFVPRLADDRVGYFQTVYQDYSELDTPSPYVRYIDRWHLKKKNPDARISEPVEPIVYWVDKRTPLEYRDAVAEGIEFWNEAFERIGFRNAVIAKQMPDTATWDPADVRYNTVQWMVQPGGGYAVGPHRSNPFTGQIYDADIRVSADFIRYMFNFAENWIRPLSFDGLTPEGDDPFEAPERPQLEENGHMFHQCRYAEESCRDAAFAMAYLNTMVGDLADKDSLTKEYVHAYIVELVAHEVGHTLGLRHNFKASSIYTLEQMSDRDFTRRYGTTGSIMDYAAANLAPPGMPQGEFYASVPGTYDNWAIEYGYTETGAATPEEDLETLNQIASRGSEPALAYATDEDNFGGTMKGIDPYVNTHDLGADPLEFCKVQVALTQELWTDAIKDFEKPGNRWQQVRDAFQTGWRSYSNVGRLVPKFVGGIDHRRSHIGDPNARVPFEPISARKQREAVAYLKDVLFAANAFDIPADLLNKLQSEDLEDFAFSAYSRSQVDYPLHEVVLAVQNRALNNLYSPYVLGRLVNNVERLKPGEEAYTMYDLFTEVRRSIWGEIVAPNNVNSFRRQLQLSHLNRLIAIYLSSSRSFPADARTLAANDLDALLSAAKTASASTRIDDLSRAHFKEVARQIEAAQSAQRTFTGR